MEAERDGNLGYEYLGHPLVDGLSRCHSHRDLTVGPYSQSHVVAPNLTDTRARQLFRP